MPNTLFHLGLQIPIFSRLLRTGDIHFVLLGAIVPDLPWILQRLVGPFYPNALDLRAYCIVQSSLLLCLLVSGAVALCFRQASRAFAFLSLGSLMHLLLDAMQTKFANGILLFAPLDWQLLNMAWLKPEHWLFTLGSILGLVVLYWQRRLLFETLPTLTKSTGALAGAAICALLYLALPWTWQDQAYHANSHFIQTLARSSTLMQSTPLEIDRGRYSPLPQPHIRVGTGEVFAVRGLALADSGIVSTKGILRPGQDYEVQTFIRHTAGWRDSLSIVGLLILVLIWGSAIGKNLRQQKPGP